MGWEGKKLELFIEIVMNKIECCVLKNMYIFWLLNEYCKDLFVLGLELVLNRINFEVLLGII